MKRKFDIKNIMKKIINYINEYKLYSIINLIIFIITII